MSWGLASSAPALTEVNPDGALAYELVMAVPYVSYRAFRSPWNPSSQLAIANTQPRTATLAQNYPNPFNPSTTISYTLTTPQRVTLSVYDMLGRQVAELANGVQSSGLHSVQFKADALPSGTYSYRLNAGGVTMMKTMMLVK